MAYSIELHPLAEVELREAVDCYDEQKEGLGKEFARTLPLLHLHFPHPVHQKSHPSHLIASFMSKEILPEPYGDLLAQIGEILTTGRRHVYQVVNTSLLKTYWEIGRHIVEFEQGGQKSAVYGKELLKQLAKDLTRSYGKGFSQSNVYYMR